MFGHTATQALGRPLTLVMPARYQEAHAAGIARTLGHGRPSQLTGGTVEVVGRRNSGEEFPLELSLAGPTGTTATAILRDLTARRAVEAERERLIVELQQALAEVRTLRGIIPICSSCKKIRDDSGYWHAVDAYVHAHTEAQFSHGICPDCCERLYPGMAQEGEDTPS
jgi:PAS domain S-box-containing protein